MQQKMQHSQRANSGPDIIQHNASTFRKGLQLPNRWRLDDIESSKKYKTCQQTFPRKRNPNQGYELSSHLVDHYELGVFQR